jgi:hypothetical protein
MIPPQLVEIATRLLSPDASPDVPSDVSSTTPDNTDQLIREIFNRYPMEHTATDQFTSLLNQFPTRNQPSKTQNVLGLLSGLGAGSRAATYDNGTPIGFRGGSAEDVMKATDLTRFRPFYQEMGDWQAKVKPYEAAALNERYYNQNQRTLASNEARQVTTAKNVASQVERREAQTTGEAEKRDIEWYKAWIQNKGLNQPNIGLAVDGATNTIIQYDKKGGKPAAALIDPLTGEPMKGEKLPLLNKSLAAAQKRAETMAGASQANTAARIAGANRPLWTDDEGNTWMPDFKTGTMKKMTPADATQEVPVTGTSTPTSQVPPSAAAAVSPSTATEPNKLPKLTKLGSAADRETASTRATEEFAGKIYPHFQELRDQAKDLEKRHLFGPVMSRIRGYAEKLGTTGSPESIEANFKSFQDKVLSDKEIKDTNDYVVGQFAGTLALLASGAGRVHAQGRTGIEMIRYMKQVLSAEGTLPMFLGRLDALDSFIKGYAAKGGIKVDKKSEQDQNLKSEVEKALNMIREKREKK